MNKTVLAIGIIFLLIGVSFTGSSYSLSMSKSQMTGFDGNILYVGGDGEGNYSSIQDAIDNASDGDTVFVYDYSSPYYENLLVDVSINLIGEDKKTTVIHGSNSEIVVNISADGVTISGFTIQNSSDLWFVSGIKIHSNYNIITGNIISNNNLGIILYHNSSNNTIKDNIISSNDAHGIWIDKSSDNTVIGNSITLNKAAGICLSASSNTVIDNSISHNDMGIIGGRSSNSNTIINNNIISNNQFGIRIYYSSKSNIIKYNKITSHKNYGIRIEGSNNNIIGNIISETKGFNLKTLELESYGIFIEGSNNYVKGNIISNTRGFTPIGPIGILIVGSNNDIINNIISRTIGFFSYGIFLTGSNNNITGNTISHTKGLFAYGLSVEWCQNTTISKNNFIKNTRHAHFFNPLDYINTTVWDKNYWNKPRTDPYRIKGKRHLYCIDPDPLVPGDEYSKWIHWYQFDENPAQEPYDITITQDCGIE